MKQTCFAVLTEALPHQGPLWYLPLFCGQYSFEMLLQRPRCCCVGSIVDYRVVPSLVCPAQRLTYHEVDAALGEQPAVGHIEDKAALLALQQVFYPRLRQCGHVHGLVNCHVSDAIMLAAA